MDSNSKFDRFEAALLLDNALHEAAERIKFQLLHSNGKKRSISEWRRFHAILIRMLNRHAKMYERKVAVAR